MVRAVKFSVLVMTFLAASTALTRKDEPSTGKGGVPEISPAITQSHDEFYGKDYDKDLHPPVDKKLHKFPAPYPIVQDPDEFDRDFVSDKNSDGGEWASQMAYDEARHKLRKEQEDVKAAADRVQVEKENLEAMEAEEKKAEFARKSAQIETSARTGILEAARGRLEQLREKRRKDLRQVEDAVGKVDKGVSHLEECKRELEEAKANLAKLLKDKLEQDKEFAESIKEELKAAEDKVDTAQKAYDTAAAEAKEKQDIEAEHEKQVDKVHQEHELAIKNVEQEQAEEKAARERLEKATDQLRATRYDGSDSSSRPALSDVMARPAVLPPVALRNGASRLSSPMSGSLLVSLLVGVLSVKLSS